MSKTASYVKDRYNAKTYDRYTFYIRKDEALNDHLQAEKQKQPISQTMKDALSLYYSEKEKQPAPGNTRSKTNRPQPSYTTKRQRRTATKKIIDQLQQIRDAEEISRDNFPENLQSSPAFNAAEECITALDEALEMLSNA